MKNKSYYFICTYAESSSICEQIIIPIIYLELTLYVIVISNLIQRLASPKSLFSAHLFKHCRNLPFLAFRQKDVLLSWFC